MLLYASLKEEPLLLAIDFVANQIVLVRPVSVVRGGRCAIVRLAFASSPKIGNKRHKRNGKRPANQVWKPDSAG
jgi:hypothetical protein